MNLNIKELNTLKKSVIFEGIDDDNIVNILDCLSSVYKTYEKDNYLYHIGDKIESIGLVLSGSVTVERYDLLGNRKIIAYIHPGDIFGESYACVNKEPLMVNIVASEDCEILFMNVNRVLTLCGSSCEFHNKLVSNLLNILALKNLNFTRKLEILTQKTTREKIMLYLEYEASKFGSTEFSIPFNRQQLADFLSVDRSALSSELSKMQKDGLIEFQKNKFKINI